MELPSLVKNMSAQGWKGRLLIKVHPKMEKIVEGFICYTFKPPQLR